MENSEIQKALELLKANGFQVTAQLPERKVYNQPAEGMKLKLGIVADTESTGLDTENDKMIELGMIMFEYDPQTCLIYRVIDTYSGLEDPGIPIPEEATRTNGITDEMVAGKRFDDYAINAMVLKASIIIAHNAGFDRKMLERRFKAFAIKPFACSIQGISWASQGMGSAKLDYLLYKLGFHFRAHRAVNDCFALLEALNAYFEGIQKTAFACLMESARKTEFDIALKNTPFDSKDLLKKRNYRWFDDGKSKHWHIEVEGEDVDAELAWAKETIFNGGSFTYERKRIDAFNRFSNRNNDVESIKY